MMRGTQVRAAIIGFGHAGRDIHLPLMRAAGIDDVTVVATSARARADAEQRGLPVVDDLSRLAPGSVDLMVIAVPDAQHEEFALKALDVAPRCLVIDKPLATSYSAALRIIEAARSVETLVVPFQNRRWDGDFLTLRSLVETDALGRIVRIESRISRWSPETGASWRDHANPGLNGQLGGNGSHLVDQVLHLFGPAVCAYAEVRTLRIEDGPNDDCFLALRHDSGVLSHLLMSSLSASDAPRFTVYGTAGTYTVDGMDPQQDRLREGLSVRGTPVQEGRVRHRDVVSIPTLEGDWADFYRGLEQTLTVGSPPPVEASDALDTLRILEDALGFTTTGRQ